MLVHLLKNRISHSWEKNYMYATPAQRQFITKWHLMCTGLFLADSDFQVIQVL